MMMNGIKTGIVLVLALLFSACAHGGRPHEDKAAPMPPFERSAIDERAQDLAAAINLQDAQTLVGLYTPAMKAALPAEKTAAFLKGLFEAKGPITSLTRSSEKDRKRNYMLLAEKGSWALQLVLDSEGRISGLSITEPADALPPVVETTVPMRLPVEGEWFVFWGGATDELNQHLGAPSQRRATDLVIMDAGGKSHGGDGKRNEDYYAFGKTIVSASQGKVVVAIDGVPDNVPGVVNSFAAVGNMVVVQQAPAEFVVYAHLKQGTVAVKVGEEVKPGQRLGLCGNSGRSTEAHLHFHVQNQFALDGALGLEAVISGASVAREGKILTPDRYTFLKGDRISNPEAK